MTLTLDLLRHGEPVGGPRYRGRSDDPLSGRGWLQMHQAVAGRGPWQRIHSSPLKRCREFAQRLAHQRGVPLQIDAGMSEIDFGRWEGQTAARLMRREAEALGRFWRDPLSHTPHGGETLSDYRDRIVSAWQALLAELPREGRVLMIGHGGSIRIILHHVLGIPLLRLQQIELPYACLTRLHIDWHDSEPNVRLAAHGDNRP